MTPSPELTTSPTEAALPSNEAGTISEFARHLFDTHAPRLLTYLRSRAGRAIADDLLSEVFVVVLRSPKAAELSDADQRSWLFGIATNMLRRHARDQVRALSAAERLQQATTALQHPGHEDAVVAGLDAQTTVRRFADDLLLLDPADLDLLLLVAWGGLSPTEAANALQIPPGTARSRLHRIRRTLATRPTNPENCHE